MSFIDYPDREFMMIDLANKLAGDINSHLMTGEPVSFAVPGGTTPGPIFDSLCAADLEWDRVTVMLSDERWVPESSDRSNTRLIRERLLVNRAAAAHFVPFYTGEDQPEAALDALADTLTPHLPLSVLLLGMGADMHTASIFPGADRLSDALADNAPPVLPMRAPGAPEPRLTLTAPVLKGAISTHIVITGEEKLKALHAAEGLSPEDAPISTVLKSATIHWAP